MHGTYFSPAEPAVARWLRRLKLAGYLPSAEAADLLRDRLVTRRRALVLSAPGFTVAATLLIYAVTRPPAVGRSHSPRREWPWLLVSLLLTLSIVCWHELSHRFDKRTGSRLLRRVTRPIAAKTRVVLGRAVMAGIALAVVLQIVMGAVLFTQRVDLVSWDSRPAGRTGRGRRFLGCANSHWLIGHRLHAERWAPRLAWNTPMITPTDGTRR